MTLFFAYLNGVQLCFFFFFFSLDFVHIMLLVHSLRKNSILYGKNRVWVHVWETRWVLCVYDSPGYSFAKVFIIEYALISIVMHAESSLWNPIHFLRIKFPFQFVMKQLIVVFESTVIDFKNMTWMHYLCVKKSCIRYDLVFETGKMRVFWKKFQANWLCVLSYFIFFVILGISRVFLNWILFRNFFL